MFNYENTENTIHLHFIGIDKDGTYMYLNPTITPPKAKPRNDDAKTIFEEVFGKKR